MSFKIIATITLATGLAAAKPINAPQSLNNLLGQGFNGAVVNGNKGNGFNFIDGFNNFNQQQQVLQIQEQNLQISNNGFQQQVVQQVQQVLVVDQVNNGFNNDLNNLFRKSNFQNRFQDVSTVMLVVQEIQISVDNGGRGNGNNRNGNDRNDRNGRGGNNNNNNNNNNVFQANIFAQSAVVANRGARQTQTIMVFDSRTLIAQDVLRNNAFGNIGQVGGIAGATGVLNNALPTKTAGIQLFGAKPTWSSVAEDPAASLGGIWQSALEDLQKGENDQQDNQLNERAAEEEKKKLDEAAKGENKDAQNKEEQQKQEQEQEQKKQEEQKQGEQNKDEQKAEQNKDAQNNNEEQKQEQQKADEQKQNEQKAEEAKQNEQKAEEQKQGEQKADEQNKDEQNADANAQEKEQQAAAEVVAAPAQNATAKA
ncbi:uncharacterized protein K460DRAFT_388216 [Cucurbitaria berberidis CBS 394.84]|uniref:Uncharacterized protein n=1 Tax=Cucurbitaria berberidis CBS 394.84 TaxID=1168544 RepID=A0A9P4GFN7_9PLEO|nr:uncharacterized protein K460DRAFT_388216 [Cucurbitaria berberidis CBS 394.84]KAF1844374.1 hypothetical protein K460DRAFT_388216 [Cucurbitaria berberidis CBS 394.84]